MGDSTLSIKASIDAEQREPNSNYGLGHVTSEAFGDSGGRALDAKSLEARAAAAVAESETKDLTSRFRPDFNHDATLRSPAPTHETCRQLQSPLRLHTRTQSCIAPLELPALSTVDSRDSRGSISSANQASGSTLSTPQQISPSWDTSSASPCKERLPSFRQLTGQLSELAEAAATQEVRPPFSHHTALSFSSTASQSPRLLYHSPFPQMTQPSQTTYYTPITLQSPSISVVETHAFGSPPQFTPASSFHRRRISYPSDHNPALPPSLPSTSSGESQGNSSGDAASTAQTTPTDHPIGPDGQSRPVFPLPTGVAPISGILNAGYRCDYPDCTAQPFQTQYLLSSHRNVHSQDRPHYCPVQDCPRSEGGKGFKRKNEMIRHGLVHNSPGYICPFCPDREHKYPRPDNLQRHVRVHHVDRDKDDPLLRDVLAQRAEGTGKTRRRRTLTASSSGCPPVIPESGPL